MKPVRVDPITGISNFLSTMCFGNIHPEKQITEKLQDITVDTRLAPDTGIWETGIKRTKIEGKWVIVEQYKNENAAQKGHKKWVKLMTEHPDSPIKDIDIWSLGIGD